MIEILVGSESGPTKRVRWNGWMDGQIRQDVETDLNVPLASLVESKKSSESTCRNQIKSALTNIPGKKAEAKIEA